MTYFFHEILLFAIVLGSSLPLLGIGNDLQPGLRCFLCPSTDKSSTLPGNWPKGSCTLRSALLPLAISFDSLASVVIIRSAWITLFTSVLWPKVGLRGSKLYFPVLAQPVHLCLYVTSVLAFLLTNSGLSRGSLLTWLMFAHTLYRCNAMISVFILSLPVPLS